MIPPMKVKHTDTSPKSISSGMALGGTTKDWVALILDSRMAHGSTSSTNTSPTKCWKTAKL